MLIDPKGLLRGDRVGACSDEAQLHFPRLLAASNTYGRFRMSVNWLHAEVYDSFHVKPTKEQLTEWLKEYNANFLLFVYDAPDGSKWAQWDIPARLLGSYRAAADRKTPAPPEEELKAFRFSYAESVRMRNRQDPDLISAGFHHTSKPSKTFQNISETSETVEKVSHDVLIGVGVGVNAGVGVVSSLAAPEPTTPEKQEKPTDPRHIPFREAVHEHWRQTVPEAEAAPWDGSEASALTKLLRANSNLTVEQFVACLHNRAGSVVQASDRPRRWLETVTDYLSGPKDEYGKPLQKRAREPGVRSRAVSNSDETRKMLEREESERKQARQEALEFWEHCKANNVAKYAEAPAWVKKELEVTQ